VPLLADYSVGVEAKSANGGTNEGREGAVELPRNDMRAGALEKAVGGKRDETTTVIQTLFASILLPPSPP
jgi:hypothetical protein